MSGRDRLQRKRRSQSCFQLQGGRQHLHASLSTLTLPHSLSIPPQTSSQPASLPDLLSPSQPLLAAPNAPYRPNRASRLRVRSAPATRPEPDYEHMARRRKESALLEKSISVQPVRKTEVSEGETLHSFLVGGRYNSSHHIDTRSLQRLGVYVPRNTNSKSFINSAGTTPPSPAVYGVHPLRRHRALVVSSSPANTHDRGLVVVKQDLERQFNGCLTCESKHSLSSKNSSLDISIASEGKGSTVLVGTKYPVSSTPEQANCNRTQHPVGPEEATEACDDRQSTSSVVSASNLLSPEAQLLTREILLESVRADKDRGSKTKLSPKRGEVSKVCEPSQSNVSTHSLGLRSASLPRLVGQDSTACCTTRPKSALHISKTSNRSTTAGPIVIDLKKLKF